MSGDRTGYRHRPEWAHFLSAVRASPDDDLTRLVAADWLDEHGFGERASLIRVGCATDGPCKYMGREVFRGPNERCVASGCPRCERLRGMAAVPDDGWKHAAGLPKMSWESRVRFSRGFVVEVVCTPAEWRAGGAAVVAESVGLRAGLRDDTPGQLKQVRPTLVALTGGYAYTWDGRPSADRQRRQNGVPWEFVRLMTGHVTGLNLSPRVRAYRTEAEADAALSDALVKWAAVTVATEDATT